jgi:hypothetical protein
MRKIKVDNSKIIDEILKLEAPIEFMADLISGFYTEKKLIKNYKEFFDFVQFDNEKYQQSIFYLIKRIFQKSKNWKEILNILMRDITSYIESMNYHNKTIEELHNAFELDLCNSLHGHGTSPEEMIFYYFSKNVFKGEKVLFCLEKYKEYNEQYMKKFKDTEKAAEKTINTTALSFNEKIKLEDYISEKQLNANEDIFFQIAKELKLRYNEENKTYEEVPRGALLYIYQGVDERENSEQIINYFYSLMIKSAVYLDKQKENIAAHFEHDKMQKEYIYQSQKALTECKKHILFLEDLLKKEKSEKDRDLKKELNESEKENYYLKTQIEKLKLEIQELKLEKDEVIVEENIEITEEKIIKFDKLERPSFSNIIIAGGKWSEQEKEAVIYFFDTNEVKFVVAEDIIRNKGKIRNADYLIFDTSFNAHKNYNLCKTNAENFLHIKHSSIDEISKLFQ